MEYGMVWVVRSERDLQDITKKFRYANVEDIRQEISRCKKESTRVKVLNSYMQNIEEW
jgi:regulator of PEP synthase PpsR (kinase-PPPase family)